MAYTNAQIKDKFLTYIDEYYTGYWDDTQLTPIAQKAVSNIVELKLRQDGSTDKVDDEISILKEKVIGATSTIDLDALTFKKLGSLSVKYASGFRQATPTKDVEIQSAYSIGTSRYPKYHQYAIEGVRTMFIEPSTGLTAYEMFYYKQPLATDGTSIDFATPGTSVLYPDKMIELIIDEMVRLTAQIIREQELQVSAQNNEVMNP